MKVLRSLMLVSILAASPMVAWGHFNVYWKSYSYEHDNGIRYDTGIESSEQCIRSRYGDPYSPWPCERVKRRIPGDTYYFRKNYHELLRAPYDDASVYRGLHRLRDRK